MKTIYLDYSRTTPVAASVRESMLPFLGEFYGHPSSSHWFGRAIQEAIEDARSNLSTLLHCHPSEIVFTSGGTESINLALLGAARAVQRADDERPHFICSSLEHACVHHCAAQLDREGWQVSYVGCSADGVVRLDELKRSLRPTTRLVSIVHANHRIGTIQPVDEIAQVCKDHNERIIVHTDACQTCGKVDCDVERLGVDLLSLSGHKFYAPMGVGALYLKLGVPLEPILFGEGSDGGVRPGTANAAHIVGLGQAARLASAGMESSYSRLHELREELLSLLECLLGARLRVHGREASRLPNLLCIEIRGISAVELHRRLPEICFGPSVPFNGTRATQRLDRSLAAIGLSDQQAACTLQLSVGWTTSQEELQQAAQAIAAAVESMG